jgi:hypothetical protein
VGWEDTGFEPRTAGQQSGVLPLSYHASLIELPCLHNIVKRNKKGKNLTDKKLIIYNIYKWKRMAP